MNKAEYKGHAIDVLYDLGDEEVRKIGFDVFLPGSWERDHHGRIVPVPGKPESIMLDLSPYSTVDFGLCAAVIDLGFPTREDALPNGSVGPLCREDVEKLWRAKFEDAPMPAASDCNPF